MAARFSKMSTAAGPNTLSDIKTAVPARRCSLLAHLRWFAFFLLLILPGAAPSTASLQAAETEPAAGALIMITSESCPWCRAFEDEVGNGYHNTAESHYLPLRRVDFHQPLPDDLAHLTPAFVTPTFIILHQNLEVARIQGYPGAELFWWQLSEFIPESAR